MTISRLPTSNWYKMLPRWQQVAFDTFLIAMIACAVALAVATLISLT